MNLGLFFIISSLEKRKNVRDQVRRVESLSRDGVGSVLLILSSCGFSRIPLRSQLVHTGQLLPGHGVSSFRPVMTESDTPARFRDTRGEKHSVLGYGQPLLSSRILIFLAKKLRQITFCFLRKNENFTPNSKCMDLFG